MAHAYNYSNIAIQTTLAGNITAGGTTISVVATTGFPVSLPYILAIDYGAATEELVKVTAVAGLALTCERGFGGTSAQTHSLGAVVRHTYNAVDATDFRAHEDASTGVHGLTGAVVGTSDTQTLTNKTLTSPTINSGALSGTLSGSPTFSGTPTFTNPSLNGAALSGTFTGTPTFSGQAVFSANPKFRRSNALDAATGFEVTGDTVSRLNIRADGALFWGPGGAGATDVSMSRSGTSALQIDGDLGVIDNLDVGADLSVTGAALISDGATVTGPGGSSTTVTVAKEVGQTGNLQTWSLGGDVLAQVNANGEANFAVQGVNSGIATASSGWTLAYEQAAIKAGIITMSLGFTRTGGTITASATGDITDTSFCTIASQYRPDTAITGNTMWFTYSTGAAGGSSELNPVSGIMTINTLNGGASIVNTNQIRMTLAWPLAGP